MKTGQKIFVIFILLLSVVSCMYILHVSREFERTDVIETTGVIIRFRVVGSRSFIALEGYSAEFRTGANQWDMIELTDTSLQAGETVTLLFENYLRGGYYSIHGITTENWSVDVIQGRRNADMVFQIVLTGFALLVLLGGILFTRMVARGMKELNELKKAAESKDTSGLAGVAEFKDEITQSSYGYEAGMNLKHDFEVRKPKINAVVGIGSMIFWGAILILAATILNNETATLSVYLVFSLAFALGFFLAIYGICWKVEVYGDEITYRPVFGRTRVFSVDAIDDIKIDAPRYVFYGKSVKLYSRGKKIMSLSETKHKDSEMFISYLSQKRSELF